MPKRAAAAEVLGDIVGFIRENYPDGEAGIVYCFSRRETEQARPAPRCPPKLRHFEQESMG